MRRQFGVPLVLSLVLVACGSSRGAKSSPATVKPTTAPVSKLTGSITVSAAASMTDAFDELGTDFTRANPAVTVAFNFGSSSTLATQIVGGAPTDAFASADQTNMDKLSALRLVGPSSVFARNRLMIVTKLGNPKHVKTLADLATVGTVSLCGAEVPCGKYATQALQTAGVTIPESQVTRGVDVKATLGAVTIGDADAAIVYATDAKTAGASVTSVTIPDAHNVIAVYPIAGITAGAHAATVAAFIAYVESAKGQATLRSFGFLPAT